MLNAKKTTSKKTVKPATPAKPAPADVQAASEATPKKAAKPVLELRDGETKSSKRKAFVRDAVRYAPGLVIAGTARHQAYIAHYSKHFGTKAFTDSDLIGRDIANVPSLGSKAANDQAVLNRLISAGAIEHTTPGDVNTFKLTGKKI